MKTLVMVSIYQFFDSLVCIVLVMLILTRIVSVACFYPGSCQCDVSVLIWCYLLAGLIILSVLSLFKRIKNQNLHSVRSLPCNLFSKSLLRIVTNDVSYMVQLYGLC